MPRRSFHREPEEVRQHALIAAMLDCIAERGLAGATVREVAERAGVTQGLIRRYFLSKDRLIEAAYRVFMDEMTRTVAQATGTGNAQARLARIVAASVSPPVTSSRNLFIWAAFVGTIHTDPVMAAVHRDGYLDFRKVLEGAIIAVLEARGLAAHRTVVRRHAIAVNALIDGIWLEISLAGDDFADIDIVRVALDATSAILGIPPLRLED